MSSRMIQSRPVPTEKELQLRQNFTKPSTATAGPSYHEQICRKPWGYEFFAFESKKIGIWILTVMEGHKTSMHCHFKKDTWIVVLKGCAKIDLVDGTRCLYPMDGILIPKNVFHSIGTFAPSTTIFALMPDAVDSVIASAKAAGTKTSTGRWSNSVFVIDSVLGAPTKVPLP